jgi:DNA polymerase-3 subunit delta'
MLLKNVIAQDNIKAQLLKAVQQNRVSHGQLFLGPEGCGNLAMALAFAQYLNCENKGATDACGTCPSCVKAAKYIHPDIHFTFPFVTIDKKEKCADWLPEWRQFLVNNVYGNYNDWIQQTGAENKQGNINAKECMDILHRLNFKSFESPYKILILWLPEFLEKEGNRLLKMIEEPPENTVFIFVAYDADKVINTILSRLQLIRFPRLNDYAISMQLEKQYNLSTQQSKQIAAMSEGSYREALQLLSLTENENTATLRSWMEHLYRKNIKELAIWNDAFAKWGRENQKHFFHYCIHFFREIILLQTGTGSLVRITDAGLKMAEGLSKLLDIDKSFALITLFEKSIYFIERNANARILITYVTSEIMHIIHARKPEEIHTPFFADWQV